jgi:hypothetical protein
MLKYGGASRRYFHEPTAISQRLGGIYYAAWSEIITGVIKLKPGMRRNYQKLERCAAGHTKKAKLFPQKLLLGHCYMSGAARRSFFARLSRRVCSLEPPETEFCNLLINFNAFDLVITRVYGNNAYGAFFIAQGDYNLSALCECWCPCDYFHISHWRVSESVLIYLAVHFPNLFPTLTSYSGATDFFILVFTCF